MGRDKFDKVSQFFFRHFFLFGFLLTLPASFDYKHNEHKGGVIWSDAEGYYLYLPALFIYNGFVEVPVRTPYQHRVYKDTDKHFTKYTYGVALMELPFFLVAHGLSSLLTLPNTETTGYSDLYIAAILLAAAFYVWIGLFFLKKALVRNYSYWISIATVLSVFLGTNLYHYVTREAGMSHGYSFCLFAIFIYLTPRFYEKEKVPFKMIAGMGLLAGLIVLIRPTNILLLLYLFFYNVTTWKSFQERFNFYLSNFSRLLLFPVFSFIVFIPQFLYWHHISGNFIMYSYGGEGFSNWASPRVLDVLFNIKNGWLLHTPMAALMLLGLGIGVYRKKPNMRLTLFIFLITLYVFSSWWCWWFGGALGYRVYVEYYTLLAFPLAYLIQLVFQQRSKFIKISFSILLALMIYYNQGLTDHKRGAHFTWKTWNRAMEEMFIPGFMYEKLGKKE